MQDIDATKKAAKDVGSDWKSHAYYEEAERWMEAQWNGTIWPMIQGLPMDTVLEIAPGHGRNTANLLPHCRHITIVDINAENVAYCRDRFAGLDKVEFLVGDGVSLQGVADASIDLVYSWDSMVHFDSDVVRSYLREVHRVLKPGGHAFLHHSNYTKNPCGSFRASPHWRNFMSAELLAHYAHKEQLTVRQQRVFDWGVAALDCVSILRKPFDGVSPQEVLARQSEPAKGAGFHLGLPARTPPERQRPRNICIASLEFMGPHQNGGIGTAYTTMAEVLTAAGEHVTLLDYGDKPRDYAHWVAHFGGKGIRYVAVPPAPFRLGGSWHMVKSYEAYLWLKEQNFDVVHFPEYRGGGYYSLLAKHHGLAFANTIFCVGAHSPSSWCKDANQEYYYRVDDLEVDFMERECVRLADVVVSPSAYLLGWMKSQGWVLPAHCFVQQNLLPATAGAGASSKPAKVPAISELVFFGRLEQRKGTELFCDALDRLIHWPGMSNVAITFLGKSVAIQGVPGQDVVRERAGKWPWATKILTEYSQAEALDYLKKPGRLGVMPSLIENSPYTVLECLGAGIPFVASRVGGIPELIAAADVERVTFPPQGAALAEKIRAIIQEGWFTLAAPALEPAANERTWTAWHRCPADEPGDAAPAVKEVPLVSVCLCHHNRPQYLAQAVASLEAQDYPKVELVLVDDGSTESAALRYLEELQPRFAARGWQLIRQENRYLGAARNAAARLAHGDYFLFMDDDNVAKPQEISTFVRAAQRTGADVLTTCMDFFEGDRSPQGEASVRERWLYLGGAASVGVFANCFGDANFFVRREIFVATGGFAEDREYAYQDWEFLARATLRGYRVELVPEALFYYRVAPNSMVRIMRHYLNHSRVIRPYLEAVPAPLRQFVLLSQDLRFQQERFDQQLTHLHQLIPSATPSSLNHFTKKVMSPKWRRSFRKRLTTMYGWFAE